MPILTPKDADRFRLPLGSGVLTPELDHDDTPDDGYYVALEFNFEQDFGSGPTYHLGEDWNGEEGGNSDLGDPVFAIANGIVVAVVTNQDLATSGFGNYVVLRHDLAKPIVINGEPLTHVYSLYAHLGSAAYGTEQNLAIGIGDAVTIGEQIGTLGSTGFAEDPHLHFEITLNDVLPTSDDGYDNVDPPGAPSSWADPTDFIEMANAQLEKFVQIDKVISWDNFLKKIGGEGGAEYQAILAAFNASVLQAGNDLLSEFKDLFAEGGLNNLLNRIATESVDGDGNYLDVYVDGYRLDIASFFDNINLSDGFQVSDFELTDVKHVAFVHFARNILNDTYLVPYSDVVLGGDAAYTWVPQFKNAFHRFGPGNEDNFKIVSADGSREYIYRYVNGQFDLVTDPRNSGSYNFAPAGPSLLDEQSKQHTIFDIRPWQIFGNAVDDESRYADRNVIFSGWLIGDGVPDNLPPDLGPQFGPTGDFVNGTERDDVLQASDDYTWRFFGRGGKDTIISAAQEDHIDGGDDFDFVAYVRSPSGVAVNLGLGFAHNGNASYDNLHETLISVEGVIGSGFGDILIGGMGANDIRGGAGNDILQGLTGRDFLHGGVGDDVLIGGGGAYALAGSEGDILTGAAGSDVFKYLQEDIPPLGTRAPTGFPHSLDDIVDYNQGNTGAFDLSEGDVIDLSDLLGSLYDNGTGDPVNSLIKLTRLSYADAALLSVDTDGAENGENWIPVAVLSGLSAGTKVAFTLDSGADQPEVSVQNGLAAAVTDLSAFAAATIVPDVEVAVRGIPGSWLITPSSHVIDEGAGAVSFTLRRPTTDQPETIYVSTTIDQGATNNNDYDFWLNVPITFDVGDDDFDVTININDDNSDEGIETFGLIVQSSPDQPASEYLAQATFSIIDDDLEDEPPVFTENDDLVWISPTGGAENFNGLAGDDTVVLDLTSWDTGISTSFSSGARTFTSGSNSLRFVGVESFFVIAGSGNDTLTTGAGFDGLFGGAGNDILNGGVGPNILDGGSGDDRFNGVGYGDTVAGGAGADTVNFNVGSITENITINLGTGEGAGGSWTGVEFVNGTLGSGDDDVTAYMQLGNINGGGGTDSITLDYSGALWDGRTATRINFSSLYSTASENVTLSDGTTQSFNVNAFERHIITATPGNDVIDGRLSSAGNVFYGLGGNDRFTAGPGADVLDGGAGDDNFDSVGVGDAIVGGSGVDTVNLAVSGLTTDVTVDLTTGAGLGASWTGVEFVNGTLGSGDDDVTAYMQLGNINGGGGTDSITLDYSGALWDGRTATRINFSSLYSTASENVTLSDGTTQSFNVNAFERHIITATPGNDVIDGRLSSAGNVFYGLGGNDRFTAGPGADVLDGGAGDDTFNSVGVGDAIMGGSGVDTVNLAVSGLTTDVTVDLTTGEGLGASWTGVEFVNGTLGSGDDDVTAYMQLGYIDGGGGTDSITLDYSGALWDGRTATRINFSSLYSTASENVTLSDGTTQNFHVNNFERHIITATPGNDVIDGRLSSAGNVFYGLGGNDTLSGSSGSDMIGGGLGLDTITLGAALDQVFGTLDELNGDLIRDFEIGEIVVVKNAHVTSFSIAEDNGDTLLSLDQTGDGIDEAVIRFENFGQSSTFAVTYSDNETTIKATTIDGSTITENLNLMSDGANEGYLVGTSGNDVIRSLAGNYDTMSGGLGADEFVFGEESRNGIRERNVILDYEVGVDSIYLENGAAVGSIRQSSGGAVVFLDGDRDAIYVRGDGVDPANLTIFTEVEFDFV